MSQPLSTHTGQCGPAKVMQPCLNSLLSTCIMTHMFATCHLLHRHGDLPPLDVQDWCLQVDVSKASNVLDRWINAASRSLTSFVTQEMDAYRLYTVVPVLVKFIDNLTNIYVRYNRRRLKGSKGVEDTMMALVSLYDVLLTVCKVWFGISAFTHAATPADLFCSVIVVNPRDERSCGIVDPCHGELYLVVLVWGLDMCLYTC